MKLTEIYNKLLTESLYYRAYDNIKGFLMRRVEWSSKSKSNKPDFPKWAHELNLQSRADVMSLKTYKEIEKKLTIYLKTNWVSDVNPYDISKQYHVEEIIDICHPNDICNCTWCLGNRDGKRYISPEEIRSEKLILRKIISRMELHNNSLLKSGKYPDYVLPDNVFDTACEDIVNIYITNLYTGRFNVSIDKSLAVYSIRIITKRFNRDPDVPRGKLAFAYKNKKFLTLIMEDLASRRSWYS